MIELFVIVAVLFAILQWQVTRNRKILAALLADMDSLSGPPIVEYAFVPLQPPNPSDTVPTPVEPPARPVKPTSKRPVSGAGNRDGYGGGFGSVPS